MSVSIEDQLAIRDLLARYCWLIDDGKGDEWAALWTENGSFTGIPDPLEGRNALRQMPGGFHGISQGKLRHHMNNVLIQAGAHRDEAMVKAYSMVSDWRDGGKLLTFAKVNFVLSRRGADWKIQSLHADMF